jgi:hypothetical protein
MSSTNNGRNGGETALPTATSEPSLITRQEITGWTDFRLLIPSSKPTDFSNSGLAQIFWRHPDTDADIFPQPCVTAIQDQKRSSIICLSAATLMPRDSSY